MLSDELGDWVWSQGVTRALSIVKKTIWGRLGGGRAREIYKANSQSWLPVNSS